MTSKFSLRCFVDLAKLGYQIGIVFQLLDDLTEFSLPDFSPREYKINPWPKHLKKSEEALIRGLEEIDSLIICHKLKNLNKVLDDYYKKVCKKLEKGEKNLQLNNIPKKTLDSISNLIGHRDYRF